MLLAGWPGGDALGQAIQRSFLPLISLAAIPSPCTVTWGRVVLLVSNPPPHLITPGAKLNGKMKGLPPRSGGGGGGVVKSGVGLILSPPICSSSCKYHD